MRHTASTNHLISFRPPTLSLAAAANKVADRVSVVPWTWGEWTEDVLALPNPDLVLASDCLYALSGAGHRHV